MVWLAARSGANAGSPPYFKFINENHDSTATAKFEVMFTKPSHCGDTSVSLSHVHSNDFISVDDDLNLLVFTMANRDAAYTATYTVDVSVSYDDPAVDSS